MMNKIYGGFTIKNDEWLSAKNSSNFKKIKTLTDMSLDKYNFHYNENDKNFAKYILNNDLEFVENIHNKNINNEKISTILNNYDSPLIIKQLIKLRYKLQIDKQKLENIIDFNFKNIYESFDKSFKINKKFIIENVNQKYDIPYNLDNIEKFTEKYLDATENINNKRNKLLIEHIKYSTSCFLSWKYINISKHAIGTLPDLMNIVIDFIEIDPKYKSPKTIENAIKIYGPYFKNFDDQKEFIDSLNIYGFRSSIPTSEKYKVMYNTDDIMKKLEFKDLKNSFSDLKTTVEFKIVIIQYLIYLLIDNLNIILKSFNEFQKKKYDNKYKDICKNIENSIQSFNNLIRLSIKNYFDIETNIDLCDRNGILSSDDSAIFRVIGGEKSIKNSFKTKQDYYPLESSISNEDKCTRLVNMILQFSVKKVDDSITLGGIILKKNIGKISIKIIYDYFERLLKNKKKNINLINKILEKMQASIYKNDLRKIYQKLEKRFLDIKLVTSKETKKIRLLTEIKLIGNEYRQIRDLELKNLLSLNILEKSIEKLPEKKLMKYYDELYIKLGYFKLKGLIYKNLVFGLYNDINKKFGDSFLPIKNLKLIEEEFNKIDDQLLIKLKKFDKKIPSEIKNKSFFEILSPFTK